MDRLTARLTSRYLSYGLAFLYLLTSISFYLHTYDSAQVKITVVQMMGTVLVGFWYLALVCDWDARWKEYWPVYLPLLAALASGLISFAHADYRGPSLDECLRRVFYIHFALIALREINTLQRLKRLTLYLLVATAVASIYGFIQFIDYKFFQQPTPGLDPFVWRQAFGPRIFSTFGNPNFFGNFLVILTPVILALLLKRHAEHPISVLVFSLSAIGVSALLYQLDAALIPLHLESWSTTVFTLVAGAYLFWITLRFSFLGVLFFLTTECVAVTESKGAWIGYIAAFVLFWLLVLRYFPQFRSDQIRRSIRRATWVTLVFAIVALSIFSRRRVESIRFRVCTWVSTWEMAQLHPLWGNGIGTFRILYPAFRRPQIFHIEAKHNTETDHAEDEYWEVLQDEGIIGFGIFIWVITTFSLLGVRALSRFTEGLSIRDPVSGKRRMSDDPRAFYMLAFVSAFWGMLMHNFMDVSLRFVSSGIFLWLLAGLIGAMVVHDPMAETDAQRDAREGSLPPGESHNPGVLVVAGAVTAVLFGFFTFTVLRQFNDVQGPLPDPFGEALLWLIAWAAMLITVGAVCWVLYRVGRSLRQVYGFIILWVMLVPLNIFWGYFMADAYHNRGIYFSKQQNWQAALDNYQKVVTLNPNYIMAFYFRGNVYTDRWQSGDVDLAMQEYKRVWRIAPNYVQSHHQAGLVYLKKGQDGRRQFDALRTHGPTPEAINALMQTKADWNESLMYFQKYHGLDPVFEPNYTRAGWVHIQLADLAKMEGKPAEAEQHYDAAEALYKESLHATICGVPENDVLGEHWSRNHRHFSGEMFENLGNLRYMRGRLEPALKAYRMSLWVDPNNVRVLKNVASLNARLGRQQDVQATWLRIRQLAPQDPDVLKVFSGKPG